MSKSVARKGVTDVIRQLSAPLLLYASSALGNEYSHGTAGLERLKYEPDFPHFAYVNPNAPKGGTLRIPEYGTYDNFNNISEKGLLAGGFTFYGVGNLVYDTLLESAIDGNGSYGRLADGVWIAPDKRQFAYRIRDGAYWHDGEPLTAADVVFSFRTFQKSAAIGIRTTMMAIDTIEQISDNEVLFSIHEGIDANPSMAAAMGTWPILPEHYWKTHDITKTTVESPLGSGPYRVGSFAIGRHVTLTRVDDYWGADLPVNRGRYNFDTINFDYFRDNDVMLEAFRGGVIDLREETSARIWETGYEFPAVRKGDVQKVLLDLDRPRGPSSPLMWNLDKKRFQDIRVREALALLYDPKWVNRVLMANAFLYADSFFFNSPMASTGLPSAAELELLEPWRGRIPERVFTQPWARVESTGYGYDRDNLKRALALFADAGWEMRDGVMTNTTTNEPFTVNFFFVSPAGLRKESSYIQMLNRVGIRTTARVIELSNWLYRMRSGKFDVNNLNYTPNTSPGWEMRFRFKTEAADSPAGLHWTNLRDPALDAMIEHMMAARTPEDLYAATRAADRIMLWNFYCVMALASPGYRLAYWDKFGMPEQALELTRAAWIDTWWWDARKAKLLEGLE